MREGRWDGLPRRERKGAAMHENAKVYALPGMLTA